MVDVEGYVSLHTNRYSVPPSFIGRQVEVRETRDHIEIELDARHIVKHRRIPTPDQVRVTLPEHRPPRGQGQGRSPSGRNRDARRRARDRALHRESEAPQPQGDRAAAAPTAAHAAGTIRAKRFSGPSKKRAAMASTIWTASNA